jgi:hypothetical protein
LGIQGALWEPRGPLETGGFLRGWGRGIGAPGVGDRGIGIPWGWGRGPHNSVQTQLVYYNAKFLLFALLK